METERERRCCGLAYTRERDIMALLQSAYITRARVFSPVRNHRGASFSFSLRFAFSSLPPSPPPAISFLLAPDSVGVYTLSSAFLTEADSGMHDGPKVSLNTPPPRESTPPRVIRGGRHAAPRRAGIAPSHPVSGVVYLSIWKETLQYHAGKTSSVQDSLPAI